MAETALAEIAWNPTCLMPPGPPLPPELAARVRNALGYVPESFPGLARAPWVLDGALAIFEAGLAHISYRLGDLAFLVVSQDNSCRFCYGASRAILLASGLSEDRIRRIEEDFHSADLPANERAALDFVRQVSRANPRPGRAEAEILRSAGFSDEAIAELAAAAAGAIFVNRLMTLTATQPSLVERRTTGILGVVFRPLMGMMLNRRRPAAPVPLGDAAGSGPFARVLGRLDGLPGCRSLSKLAEAALSEGTLPVRTKGLVLAVIVRTLGCDRCEPALVDRLEAAGIPRAETLAAIDRLGSGSADPVERLLLPLARETVRGQPRTIQPKMLEAKGALTPEQLAEFIGLACLGNAFGRLSCLLAMHEPESPSAGA